MGYLCVRFSSLPHPTLLSPHSLFLPPFPPPPTRDRCFRGDPALSFLTIPPAYVLLPFHRIPPNHNPAAPLSFLSLSSLLDPDHFSHTLSGRLEQQNIIHKWTPRVCQTEGVLRRHLFGYDDYSYNGSLVDGDATRCCLVLLVVTNPPVLTGGGPTDGRTMRTTILKRWTLECSVHYTVPLLLKVATPPLSPSSVAAPPASVR